MIPTHLVVQMADGNHVHGGRRPSQSWILSTSGELCHAQRVHGSFYGFHLRSGVLRNEYEYSRRYPVRTEVQIEEALSQLHPDLCLDWWLVVQHYTIISPGSVFFNVLGGSLRCFLGRRSGHKWCLERAVH